MASAVSSDASYAAPPAAYAVAPPAYGYATSPQHDDGSDAGSAVGGWVAVIVVLVLGIAVAALWIAISNAQRIDEVPSADTAAAIDTLMEGQVLQNGMVINEALEQNILQKDVDQLQNEVSALQKQQQQGRSGVASSGVASSNGRSGVASSSGHSGARAWTGGRNLLAGTVATQADEGAAVPGELKSQVESEMLHPIFSRNPNREPSMLSIDAVKLRKHARELLASLSCDDAVGMLAISEDHKP